MSSGSRAEPAPDAGPRRPFPTAIGDSVPCAMHPNVETHLRCPRCGKPICPKCVVHTESGGLCPGCARRPGGRAGTGGPNPLRLLPATLAGLSLSAGGAAVLTLVPFGALLVLPFLLLGLLTGEIVAAVAGRPGGPFIALVGLLSALLGPISGRALVASFSGAIGGGLGLTASAEPISALGLLLIVAGGLIAGVRAGGSRG